MGEIYGRSINDKKIIDPQASGARLASVQRTFRSGVVATRRP